MKYRHLIFIFGIAVLVSSCGKSVDINQKDEEGKEVYTMQMPTHGEVTHPVHGKETWFAYGAMMGTKQTPANGVTNAQLFEDGTFSNLVQLNIEPAPKGKLYATWLASDATMNDPSKWTRTGTLVSGFNDARHQMSFQIKNDLRESLHVLVTEQNGTDAMPGTVVANGLLKKFDRPK
jgi:hypothetical protein